MVSKCTVNGEFIALNILHIVLIQGLKFEAQLKMLLLVKQEIGLNNLLLETCICKLFFKNIFDITAVFTFKQKFLKEVKLKSNSLYYFLYKLYIYIWYLEASYVFGIYPEHYMFRLFNSYGYHQWLSSTAKETNNKDK